MNSKIKQNQTPSIAYCSLVITLYVGFVVLINTLFVYLPTSSFYGHDFTYAELAVGGVYVIRDLAQRTIGHKVIFAMILAALLSWFLADEQIAIASMLAFSVGETVDWAIFTYTKKPLSQRILWSASISSPIDSAIFLAMIGHFAAFELALMTTVKVFGAIVLWAMYAYQAARYEAQAVVSSCYRVKSDSQSPQSTPALNK